MTIPSPPSAPPPPTTPAPAPPRRPSWWRRNGVALAGIAVLLPATLIAVGWQNWHDMFGFGARPVHPIVVEEDGSAELAGAEFGPVRSVVVEDLSGLDVPEGVNVIAAAIPVDAGAEGVSCQRPTLVHQESGRQWSLMREQIGVAYNSDEPEFCLADETGRYELIAPFVVPEGVEGPFWVEVWSIDAGGSFLRFPIDP